MGYYQLSTMGYYQLLSVAVGKIARAKRYELKLDVDLKEQNYSGKVNIRIVVQNDNFNNTIWLHSKGLNITSASILFSQFSMPEEAIGVFEVPEKGMYVKNDC